MILFAPSNLCMVATENFGVVPICAQGIVTDINPLCCPCVPSVLLSNPVGLLAAVCTNLGDHLFKYVRFV